VYVIANSRILCGPEAQSYVCCCLQIDALVARDSHNAKQQEVLRSELNRLRGSNRTESLAAMHDVALQEVGACWSVCL
jgi:hypothetical protein